MTLVYGMLFVLVLLFKALASVLVLSLKTALNIIAIALSPLLYLIATIQSSVPRFRTCCGFLFLFCLFVLIIVFCTVMYINLL